MLGRTVEEARKIAGPDKPELVPHIVFPGNRPTTTLLVDALTARSLGALIALYEHKVLVQATVWNINRSTNGAWNSARFSARWSRPISLPLPAT